MTQEEKLFAKLDLNIKSILQIKGIKNVSTEVLRKCSLEWLRTTIEFVDNIIEDFESDMYVNDKVRKILSKYNPEEFGE